MTVPAIPHTMRAVRLAAYADAPRPELREVAVPWPGPGQVLVKVSASPLHFDDVVFCRGRHGFRRALPTTPGIEGAGTVVAGGAGLVTRLLMGRRVAFAMAEEHDGAWAEYAVADASRCLPIWDGLDDETAAALLVDPVAALAMLDEVRSRRHAAAVLTAPSGTVGRILVAVARAEGLPMVLVAGDEAEAEAVRPLSAPQEVLVACDPDLDGKLRRATRAWKASALLDGVGGDLTGRLLATMPDGAEAVLYGLEPGTRVEVDLSELVYRRKAVRGFSFLDRVKAQGPRGLLAQRTRLRKHAEALRLPVAQRLSLDEVPAAVAGYRREPGRGRILIRPTP